MASLPLQKLFSLLSSLTRSPLAPGIQLGVPNPFCHGPDPAPACCPPIVHTPLRVWTPEGVILFPIAQGIYEHAACPPVLSVQHLIGAQATPEDACFPLVPSPHPCTQVLRH